MPTKTDSKNAAVWCQSMTQATKHGAVLVFIALLAGCATTSGGRFRSPMIAAPSPRTFAAMSGGPAAGDASGPVVQGYNVPGRNPDSRMPWQLFLGGASHRLIAYRYGVTYPDTRAYFNKEPIASILGDTGIGIPSLLLPNERKLCPDITDITRRVLFEIKPWHEQGLLEGREEARTYLTALNRTLRDGRRFTGGTDFQGDILIRFARGQYIWRLEWRTPEPGITLYRWTRSQQRFESEAAAYEAGQWTDLSVEELRQYGGWVEKAVEDMISRREKLATVRGTVGFVIDLVGEAARVVLWSALMGQMGSGARQPPAQGGGQVIPFPARPPPAAPPAQVPAAASMPLPH